MVNHFQGCFKGKTILVTGHTGFKGCWLSLWLAELGAKVIGYSLGYPTEPNLFQAINLEKKITHLQGDILDEKNVKRVFQKFNPEFVFHLAAQSLVRFSYREPKLTFETNILGTVNILEAVRQTKNIRGCLVVTSDKCYRYKDGAGYYAETDPLGGRDPYSTSKAGAELVTDTYRYSFFPPEKYGKNHHVVLASVRSGNVIGGGDWGEDRLIPDCVRSLAQGEAVVIRSPRATRPWQYVTEPIHGYLLLAEKMLRGVAGEFAGAWNFGPDNKNPLAVEDVVKLLIKYWGSGQYTIDRSQQPFESPHLSLNARKAQTLLAWKLIYDDQEAIERTVRWYKNFYQNNIRKEKLYQLTLQEILEYSDRMVPQHQKDEALL